MTSPLPPAEREDPKGGAVLGGIAVVAVVAAGIALVIFGGGKVPPPVARGTVAPGFELPTLTTGDKVSLSDFEGHVVLVNFWATWCKPCEDEMPSMERLYRGLAPEGFELLAISVDDRDSRKTVEGFRDRMDITFPILLDPDQEVARTYQTRGFPESLLVDRHGRIVERYVGPRDWRVYRARIRELMQES